MKFLKEVLKSLLLIVFVLVGVILFKEEPIEVKARKALDSNEYLYKGLTKEELDKYMKYLRTLNSSNYKKAIK